jgi:DNA repair protein RecO (recombination protein O)
MRHFRTEGIIIKRKNLGEADRLLTVFTKDYGKMQVKAAGVRKITSRRSAHIELLNHASLSLYKGHISPVLTEVKLIDDYAAIKADFNKIGLAYHLCELIDGLCPDNQEHMKVFYLLKNTLQQLGVLNDDIAFALPVKQQEIDDYTLGTYGLGLMDAPPAPRLQKETYLSGTLHDFEIELLSELGYWDKTDALSKNFDTHDMIENILERRLKSKKIFLKLQ